MVERTTPDSDVEAIDEEAVAPPWMTILHNCDCHTFEQVVKQLQNPDFALYKLKSAASKYSFMLVPLSLPFLWLLFLRRRDVVMYDHAVFALYSLSFMALLFACVALLGLAVPEGPLALVVVLVPPVHMFLQLRGTYGLTSASALWRTVALITCVSVAFMLYMVLIAVAAA